MSIANEGTVSGADDHSQNKEEDKEASTQVVMELQ